MTYHGFKPQEDVRKALQSAHIYGYPSVWPETSCISLMEAMSAKCICVHPNLGALYETAANWNVMYPFHEDQHRHAEIFYNNIKNVVEIAENDPNLLHNRLNVAKSYVDGFYSWDVRVNQWKALLDSIRNEPRSLHDLTGKASFVYNT